MFCYIRSHDNFIFSECHDVSGECYSSSNFRPSVMWAVASFIIDLFQNKHKIIFEIMWHATRESTWWQTGIKCMSDILFRKDRWTHDICNWTWKTCVYLYVTCFQLLCNEWLLNGIFASLVMYGFLWVPMSASVWLLPKTVGECYLIRQSVLLVSN